MGSIILVHTIGNDAPPNSSKNSNASSKLKIVKEGVGIRSLAHNISGVRGPCWSFRMGTKTNDKQVNYSHGLPQTKQQVG